MTEAQPATVPALGLSYRMILDKEGRREIVFQTHVEADIPPPQLNSLLDHMCAAVDRQVARSELEQIKKELENQVQQVQTFEAALTELDIASRTRWEASGKQGPWDPKKLPANDRQSRDNTKLGIDRSKRAVEAMRARIIELQTLVSGDGASSAADSGTGVSDSQVPGNGLAGGTKG